MFNNTRGEWSLQIHDTQIIPRLTQAMIDEFGKRGICAPAGENQCSPSINWDFQIVSAVVEYVVGCSERLVKRYKTLQGKIDDENKKFDEREEEIRKIDRAKEKTIEMLDRRAVLVNENERSKKIIDNIREEIIRDKKICPDIDEVVKDGERYDRYRYLEEWIESWVYYIDEPSIKVQSTTNRFWYEVEMEV